MRMIKRMGGIKVTDSHDVSWQRD